MGIEKARSSRRRQTAALKAIGAGRVPLREVLLGGSWSGLGGCPVYRVLLAAPGLGPEGMRDTLERANHVWPFTPLNQLTKLQRRGILDNLPERIK